MTVTTDTISGYFDKLGWVYTVADESRVLTTYRCQVHAYYYTIAIEVNIGQHWVNVRALLQRDISSAHLDSILRLITRWNEASYQARFLLIGDCVVIQSEIVAMRLSVDLFVEALAAVCRYATWAGVEIAVVATNPSVRAKLDSVLTATKPHTWDDVIPAEAFDLNFDISMNRIPDE